jgi:hypothetical protein
VLDYLVPLLDFDLDLVRVAEVVDLVVQVIVAEVVVLVVVDLLVPMPVPRLLELEVLPQVQVIHN